MRLATLTAAICLTAGIATADQVTFNLSNQGHGQSSFAVTSGGITLSFSNPVGRTTFQADSDGLAVMGWINEAPDLTGWSFSFDTSVKLLSYNVSWASGVGAGDSLTYAPNTAGGWTDTNFSVSTHNFSSQAILGANENVNVTTNGDADFTFSSITVDTDVPPPVPLPGAVWGMIAGLGALGAAARRRKTA